MSANVEGGEELSGDGPEIRNCACGCGEALPPDAPGRRGRKRVFARPACQAAFREARLGGWTPDSDLTSRAFVAARRAGLRDDGAGAQPVAYVNRNACACGCGAPAKWARGSCARRGGGGAPGGGYTPPEDEK